MEFRNREDREKAGLREEIGRDRAPFGCPSLPMNRSRRKHSAAERAAPGRAPFGCPSLPGSAEITGRMSLLQVSGNHGLAVPLAALARLTRTYQIP